MNSIRRRGFTHLELIIVLALLAGVAGIIFINKQRSSADELLLSRYSTGRAMTPAELVQICTSEPKNQGNPYCSNTAPNPGTTFKNNKTSYASEEWVSIMVAPKYIGGYDKIWATTTIGGREYRSNEVRFQFPLPSNNTSPEQTQAYLDAQSPKEIKFRIPKIVAAGSHQITIHSDYRVQDATKTHTMNMTINDNNAPKFDQDATVKYNNQVVRASQTNRDRARSIISANYPATTILDGNKVLQITLPRVSDTSTSITPTIESPNGINFEQQTLPSNNFANRSTVDSAISYRANIPNNISGQKSIVIRISDANNNRAAYTFNFNLTGSNITTTTNGSQAPTIGNISVQPSNPRIGDTIQVRVAVNDRDSSPTQITVRGLVSGHIESGTTCGGLSTPAIYNSSTRTYDFSTTLSRGCSRGTYRVDIDATDNTGNTWPKMETFIVGPPR